MTHFLIYPETELACKYNKPLHKTQYFRSSCRIRTKFPHEYRKKHHKSTCNTSYKQRRKIVHPSDPSKNRGNTGGKLKPQEKDSARLQELSLMHNTYFGAIRYDIHLDMKLDYKLV